MFEGSIGNTSDNLEAVSEAASNHSVASSLELETEDQNDNLSDMVSANVSGRGTPNISGTKILLNYSFFYFLITIAIINYLIFYIITRSRYAIIPDY